MPAVVPRRHLVVPRPTALIVAAAALVACSSDGATSPAASTGTPAPAASSPAAASTAVTTSSTTSTTPTSTTTTAPAIVPEYVVVPEGRCADLVDGSIGFTDTSGTAAGEYRRIGTSTQGRPIWAEHRGSFAGPQVLVLGQVHGDECAPAFFVHAIRERPPADFGIWLVPTVNPDGLAAHTRRTALDVDPNRDGFDLVTPEAQAVMSFTEEIRPALTVHVHSPYGWVGAFGGPLATYTAEAMSQAAGWGGARRAGEVKRGTQAFLWEGQAVVLPGAQAVLVEFPGLSPEEAPDAPDPSQVVYGTVEQVQAAAVAMRDALYSVMSSAG